MKKVTRWYVYAVLVVIALLFNLSWYVHENWLNQKESPTTKTQAPGCSITLVSWNMGNFGKSKSEATIEAMAKTVCKTADVIAAQEITAGQNVGAQAVAKLAAACSRMGSDWDYIVSDPTAPQSPGVERYAYLWRKSKISVNRDTARLLKEVEEPIDREPFVMTFQPKGGQPFSTYTMHAVPTAKNPIEEIRALEKSKELQSVTRAIFSGDFNLDKRATDPSFQTLGFTGYIDQPTSLKTKVTLDRYKVKQYDNIYAKKDVHVCSSGVIDFVENSFSPVTNESLTEARKLSDHLPVYIKFK